MVTIHPRLRLMLFIIGLLLITFGAIGLLVHAPWGDVANSLFTIFGMFTSFAQFVNIPVGFNSPSTSSPVNPFIRTNKTKANQPSSTTPPQTVTRLISSSGSIDLNTSELTIGRAPDNQHVLNDAQVSTHHAIICPQNHDYAIMDLGSTNGTFVNGQRLTPKVFYTLESGETIRIGTTTFTFEMNPATEIAKTMPAYTSPPSSQTYSAYAPPPPPSSQTSSVIAPPPPRFAYSHSPYSPQKVYRKSAITLFVAAGFYLLALFVIFSTPPADLLYSLKSFQVIIYILLLCTLRGIHAKQAHQAGWLGTISIMMVAAGAIINVLIGGIFVGNYMPGVPISSSILTTIRTLYLVNLIFLIFGDILFGISIIRARVYPRWTGIVFIVVGVLNIFGLDPQATVIQALTSILLAAVFIQIGRVLIKPSPVSPPQYVHQ